MKKILLTFVLLCSLSNYAQWEPISLPTTENLIRVWFKDNTTGFCIAENGILLKTTDGGSSWIVIQNNPNLRYKHLACTTDKVVIFGTNIVDNTRKVFTSLDNGVSWTIALSAAYPLNENEEIQVLNDEIYFKGSGVNSIALYRFNDNNPVSLAEPALLFGTTESTDEIVYFNNDWTGAHLYKSIDNGATWQELTNTPPYMSGSNVWKAKIQSFNTTLVTHYPFNGGLAHSLDNGTTWNLSYNSANIIETAILNSTTIYGIRFYKIYINTDYINWVEQIEVVNGPLKNIYFKSPTLGFAIGDNGAMYRTVNGGLDINKNELLAKSIKVYPVPAKDIAQIEIPLGLKVVAINLYDTNGRLLQNLNTADRTVHISNLPSGIYVLKVSTTDGVVTKKIIVQ